MRPTAILRRSLAVLVSVVLCCRAAGAAHQKQRREGASYKQPQDASTTDKEAGDGKEAQKIHDSFGDSYGGEEPLCRDLRADCPQWAANGGCEQDPAWMRPHCPVSCRACDMDNHSGVRYVPRKFSKVPPAEGSVEDTYTGAIADAVGAASLGVPQVLTKEAGGVRERIYARVREARAYLRDVVQVQELYEPVREICQTYEDQCAYWAVQGECEANAEFMNEHCAPVCFTCEQLHVSSRCPIDPNEKNGKRKTEEKLLFLQ